jgi:transketolase C-terminal domain/subunit
VQLTCKAADKGNSQTERIIATLKPTAEDKTDYKPGIHEDIYLSLKVNDSKMTFPREELNTDHTYTECGSDVLLISYGRVFQSVWEAHQTCAKSGYQTSLLKLTKIFPFAEDLVEKALGYKTVIFFEESSGYGGISTIFGSLLSQYGFGGRYVRVSADCFLKQASVDALLEKAELSTHAVCRYVYAYGTKS